MRNITKADRDQQNHDHKMAREFESAAWDVVAAIKISGKAPAYHRSVMERHRAQWPALWRALDQLVKVTDTEP
jgi:hypothetical protein